MPGHSKIKRAGWGSSLHYGKITYKLHKVANRFEACVFAAGLNRTDKRGAYACSAHGHTNPRAALADALVQAAKGIRSRSGTFAGYGRR